MYVVYLRVQEWGMWVNWASNEYYLKAKLIKYPSQRDIHLATCSNCINFAFPNQSLTVRIRNRAADTEQLLVSPACSLCAPSIIDCAWTATRHIHGHTLILLLPIQPWPPHHHYGGPTPPSAIAPNQPDTPKDSPSHLDLCDALVFYLTAGMDR